MKFQNLFTLTKSEIAGYFVSPVSYVFIIIFLFLNGLFTFATSFGNFYARGNASLESFFNYIPYLYLILIPAVGMQMWSDEKRLGTNELLFTLPVTLLECIISKFIAAWMIIAVALFCTFPMVITVYILGSPDLGAIICGYIGCFLMGGAYLAISSFTSSLTKSQVVSFILSFFICLFLILAGFPDVTDMFIEWASRGLLDTIAWFSIWTHFAGMRRGVIDSRNVLYFISLIIFGLFLTHLCIKNTKAKTETNVFGAIVIGLIIILSNTILSNFSQRWDLTENKIYTLSDSSRKILSKIDKPVTIKFYYSKSNPRMPIHIKDYAVRVEDLLQEYKQAGKGNIYIEKYDPKQLSDAEDSAILDGISGQSITTGEKIYIGLAISCGKKNVAIPVLTPAKENLLEYDITSAITEVFKTKKSVIGIMSVFSVMGGPPTQEMMQKGIFQMRQPWLFVKQLGKDFTLKEVPMNATEIDKDINVLILFHPSGISDESQFAIDQFLLKGGKVIAFLDPWSLVAKNLSKTFPSLKGKNSSDMPKLLKAWGVEYNPTLAVADAIFGKRLEAQGRKSNYLSVLDVTQRGFNKDNVITSHLNGVTFLFPGGVTNKQIEGLNKESLITTTKNSCLMNAMIVEKATISFRQFSADNNIYDLGLNITGKFKTAFPEGNPSKNKKDEKQDFLKESTTESTAIIIMDADFLFDQFCVAQQNVMGKNVTFRVNDNLSLALNTVDALGGDNDMIGIRCRPNMMRPFEKIKEERAEAEKIFKAKVLELENELRATQDRLNVLQKQKKDKAQQMVISPEQQMELDKFKEQQVKVRKEIKVLQKEFRRKIEFYGDLFKYINMFAMASLVAIFGSVFGIIRKIRGGAH